GMTTTIVMTRSRHLRAVKLLLNAVVRNPNGLDLFKYPNSCSSES
ncbi:hypothetical protein CPC197_0310B, partial [Chlamydia psittaci C1/97]